jgi:hypothetical protein
VFIARGLKLEHISMHGWKADWSYTDNLKNIDSKSCKLRHDSLVAVAVGA